MVECEYGKIKIWNRGKTCFNRYMVECEFGFNNGSIATFTVLIDTWWNVNFVCTVQNGNFREF